MVTKLFHYTSINNLALILKSKSIRFGRLDKVNDPTEGESLDFFSLAPYIFVSCWTNSSEENFAIWNMYTSEMRGVRIELPLPIFESYKIGNYGNLLVSENEYIDSERHLFILPGKNEPIKIKYTDELDKLKPNIQTNAGLKLNELGNYKRNCWSIENEYRYRINIYPTDPKVKSENFLDKYDHLIGVEKPSIVEFFRKIEPHSFEKMKIRTSPKLHQGDMEIIESLIENFNPKAIIEQSHLSGLIR